MPRPEYQSPEIPEGINASRDNPLKEFLLLAAGVLAIVLLLALGIGLGAGWMASKIPFKHEARIAALVFDEATEDFTAAPELQRLARQLARRMDFPDDMPISIHYSDKKLVNAFAFLGGHIVIYRGLMDKLESENALAMVVAHELAHIRNRDPIRSLGSQLSLRLLFSALFSGDGSGVAGRLLNIGLDASLLRFSRTQELAADQLALQAVYQHYGHVNGAVDLFKTLSREQGENRIWQVELFSTHPLSDTRIEQLQTMVREQMWSTAGELTPLDRNRYGNTAPL